MWSVECGVCEGIAYNPRHEVSSLITDCRLLTAATHCSLLLAPCSLSAQIGYTRKK